MHESYFQSLNLVATLQPLHHYNPSVEFSATALQKIATEFKNIVKDQGKATFRMKAEIEQNNKWA